MPERRKLTDILHGTTRDDLARAWDQTEAAADLGPLPRGQYTALILSGEPTASRRDTPGYKLTFQVSDGEFTGRRFWHDLWLTPAALPMTKRDLLKLGVQSLDQLDRPLPPGIRCRVRLTLQRDDDGTERNRVQSFDVIGIDPPDPFAPAGDAADAAATDGADVDRGDAWEAPADQQPVEPGANGAGPYGDAGGRR
jgi:hypothetical protein